MTLAVGERSMELELGDYVQLVVRESPHTDQADWWWRIVRIHEYGMDCVYSRLSDDGRVSRVTATRLGVPLIAVKAHRKPDHHE